MKATKLITFVGALLFAAVAFSQNLPEGRLMRFPDVHGDQIAFTYGGDIWLASRQGGIARKVTADPGLELFPKFSPDGKWIAFTGQYDGNFNVYVMPAQGGVPKQLTFLPDVASLPERMGPNNMVLTWFPDSKRILFLTRRETFNTWFGRPYVVSLEGGLPEPFVVPKGGLISFSPDGTKFAYNQIFRNFRTWKRYKGGMAQDIDIYDLKTNTLGRITDWEGVDTSPMWFGETIYFTSDRDKAQRMNIYAYDVKTKKTRQVTKFTDFDVNWPSLGGNAIVFEKGGYLYLLNLPDEKVHKLTVYLPDDRDLSRPKWVEAKKSISAFSLSPDGKRALFEARGDIWTVPAKDGATRNLTRTSGVHEKLPNWSPDGKWISYISDTTGEDEIYISPENGRGEEIQITSGHKGFVFEPVWSPDNKKLMWADKDLRLWYADMDAKKPVEIDRAKYFEIYHYRWSPDSKWAVYTKAEENGFSAIYLYSLADKKVTQMTNGFTNDAQPVFDPTGKYLYFLSDRSYNAVLGHFDQSYTYSKTTKIYVTTLEAATPSPFAPLSDETEVKKAEAKPEEKPKEEAKGEKKEPVKDVKIDLAGLVERAVAFPMPPANITGLMVTTDKVFYRTFPIQGLSGETPGEEPTLHMFDMKERKDAVVLAPANNYELSIDGKKLIYRSRDTYGIIEAKAGAKAGDGALDLNNMKVKVDLQAEWREVFDEAWRQERDYFYSPTYNGVDWDKEKERYAPLVLHVANRYDLTYVIGEMIGELGNSHTYVGGGDYPELKVTNVGMLGADFELDAKSGLYRFKKIYAGDPAAGGLRGPLAESGLNVKAGDYLLAVNGISLKAPTDPYSLFENTAEQNVVLGINSQPSEQGAREITVKTIKSEFELRYRDWVENNRRKVEEMSGGTIGYIYIPDMSGTGLNEFVRQFYPQVRKQGLILDDRFNGGGFVDQMILERLRRVLAGMEASRNFQDSTIPEPVFYGYMAALANEYSASDGDFFAYFFKKYNLGPVIGKRTWGGVRGIRGTIPLIDGGYITRPEFALYSTDSRWLIENRGVEPTIEVDNPPNLVMQGRDPQLEKAVEILMKMIKENPKKLPPRPPYMPPYGRE